MLFNSLTFAIFLPVVFALYWGLQKNLRAQNLLVFLASYLFYGWWDWRFLGLLFLTSFVDFLLGIAMDRAGDTPRRRHLLWISLGLNLGVLGLFKYFNFFVDSMATALASVGVQANLPSLRLVLPVGISFYTFQSLSYTIDVYRKELKPTRNIIDFLAFVSFFPQLVAGPIERARDLLPQFYVPRRFDVSKAEDGLRQMLWGMTKKVLIADNAARQVEYVFGHWEQLSGLTLWLGVFLFAVQIYGDFSGYSDIAVGCARLFGFNLMRNFATPYFSRDIAEFWRRWHVSLSTWFRDYLYIPLGGNRGTLARQVFNVMVTFTVSGLWHGANWTFVLWGVLNGLYFIPLVVARRHRQHLLVVAAGRTFASPKELLQMGTTFFLTLVAWVFFRAESVSDAFGFLRRAFLHPFAGELPPASRFALATTLALAGLAIEWLQREREHAFEISPNTPRAWRWGLYYATCLALLFLGNFSEEEFIYFQF